LLEITQRDFDAISAAMGARVMLDSVARHSAAPL
jgi:hypothetical protein